MTDNTYEPPEHGWVCFHCGEHFDGKTMEGMRRARDHFGADPGALAACQIKAGGERALLMTLRSYEDELARYRVEDSDADRAMSAMAARHAEELRAAEERGFARGVANMRRHGWQLWEEVERPDLYPLARVDTGPLQIDDDWPGVFIRGDHALMWSGGVRRALELLPSAAGGIDMTILRSILTGLSNTLAGCEAGKEIPGLARVDRRLAKADLDFLLARATEAGSADFSSDRWTGASSNAIVAVAYGGAQSRLPSDRSDWAACVRTFRRLPRHRRTPAVRAAMRAAREAYLARYPEHRSPAARKAERERHEREHAAWKARRRHNRKRGRA